MFFNKMLHLHMANETCLMNILMNHVDYCKNKIILYETLYETLQDYGKYIYKVYKLSFAHTLQSLKLF